MTSDFAGRPDQAEGLVFSAETQKSQIARICLAENNQVVCHIERRSKSGAKLRLRDRVSVPRRFMLIIESADKNAVTDVELRWQIGTAIGIAFRTGT